jgi:hypothetical protein
MRRRAMDERDTHGDGAENHWMADGRRPPQST